MELSPVLKGVALAVVLGLPLLASDERAFSEEMERLADRRALYLTGGITLAVLALVVWGVATWQGAAPAVLGWTGMEPIPLLGWSAGTTAACLAAMAVGTRWLRALGFRESPLALFLIPRNREERRAFLLLVLVGAVCEEYVYRGFALQVLASWGGSGWAAAGFTAVSFGLAHGYQRFGGILRATLLGGLLAVPVLRTGSLAPAVLAHAGVNALVGLGGWRWLEAGDASDADRGPDSGDHEDRRSGGDRGREADREL